MPRDRGVWVPRDRGVGCAGGTAPCGEQGEQGEPRRPAGKRQLHGSCLFRGAGFLLTRRLPGGSGRLVVLVTRLRVRGGSIWPAHAASGIVTPERLFPPPAAR